MVRIKNRYLLVNILYPERERSARTTPVPDLVSINRPTTNDLTPQALLRGLKAEIALLFGDYGTGAVADNLSVKYLSPATSTVILRVARAHYQIVWAALSLMHTVPVKDGQKCIFRVVRVSGTMRKVEEEAIRRARELVAKVSRKEAEDTGQFTLDSFYGTTQSKTPDASMRDISEDDESEMEVDND
ncbi:hypothetical protein K3495_g298 [Podosphaera aphanis]|nr:hypothetical protein K3495_g298 [Podosphaera aphanis]